MLAFVGLRGPMLAIVGLSCEAALADIGCRGLRSCRGPMLAYVGCCGPTLAYIGCCGPTLAGVGCLGVCWLSLAVVGLC